MADEATFNAIKETLGYTDAQLKTWKSNPRNLKIADNLDRFGKYKLVAEVISAHGCGVGHKVGDRVVFGAGGELLCSESPERVCHGLLSPLIPVAWLILNKTAIGEDPTQLAFDRLHCTDVGVDDGGWGKVVVELKVEET